MRPRLAGENFHCRPVVHSGSECPVCRRPARSVASMAWQGMGQGFFTYVLPKCHLPGFEQYQNIHIYHNHMVHSDFIVKLQFYQTPINPDLIPSCCLSGAVNSVTVLLDINTYSDCYRDGDPRWHRSNIQTAALVQE